MNNNIKIDYIYVKENSIGQRIDNFLIKKFKKISKNVIYTIIRKGRVRINKKRIKPKYKLKIKDIIRIPPIYTKIKKKKKINKKYYRNLLNKNILYEDKYLLAINKPQKIAVHGGSGIKLGIIEIIRILYKLEKNLELVHRLDKDTSGILLISKKKFVLKSLHKQMKDRKTKKTYIAAVHGIWPEKIKTINLPLLKTKKINGKNLVIVKKDGKKSKTKFKIKKIFKNFTILKVYPITGRTHQIRVHTSNVGFPIINDNRYGNRKLDKKIKINKNLLCLHALSISFIHPKTKKKINIKSTKNNISKILYSIN
ncbi:RluA family pseudouridine synthase [Buchnera aphidicola (Ceratoglyphina bambusae)]|uniref:RluA family pseudouridine synthase n=1 Tax=Buchnera aphidicola TaxID=9 RepID=UPI0031B85F62